MGYIFNPSGGSGGTMVVKGRISAAGAVLAGEGFTSERSNKGIFFLTFKAIAVPNVMVTPREAFLHQVKNTVETGEGKTEIRFFSIAEIAQDTEYFFQAVNAT